MLGPGNNSGHDAFVDPHYDSLMIQMAGLRSSVHIVAEDEDGERGLFSWTFTPNTQKTLEAAVSEDPLDRLHLVWLGLKVARRIAGDRGMTVIS